MEVFVDDFEQTKLLFNENEKLNNLFKEITGIESFFLNKV
jgi:hypothetical protein